MDDLISRQDAIEVINKLMEIHFDRKVVLGKVWQQIKDLPSAQPERTEYIPETKAIPSEKECVDLAEKVTATFYDDEHEDWSQKTVTIRDVLDSVCDEYTILPSAQHKPFCHLDSPCPYQNEEIKVTEKKGHWVENHDSDHAWKCSECGCGYTDSKLSFCYDCGSDMRGEEDGESS